MNNTRCTPHEPPSARDGQSAPASGGGPHQAGPAAPSPRRRWLAALAGLSCLAAALPAGAELTLVETGGGFSSANLATAAGATPFAQSQVGCCGVATVNLNDGQHGTSWGPAGPAVEVDSFAGINLGTERTISSIAFGRDNTGTHQDRYIGSYTLQYTTVAAPGAETPDGDWVTLGQLDYAASPPPQPSFRHRYTFPDVQATGVRILTDTAAGQLSIFLDEIEVYGETLPLPVISAVTPADGTRSADAATGLRFEVTSTIGVEPSGIVLTLNGVDRSSELTVGGSAMARVVTFSGLEVGVQYVAQIGVTDQDGNQATATTHFDTFALPGVTLIETAGTFAANNLATAPGAAPFAQSQVGCCGVATVNLNDGVFGTSWGPAGAADSFAGVSLGGPFLIDRIAFGRDNTGVNQDRYVGRYVLQYTTVASPDAATLEADWISLAILDYAAAPPAQPSFRHLYEFDPVSATGVRIVTDTAEGQLAIFLDEIEVYGSAAGLRLIETGGTFAPGNLATVLGAIPFAQSQVGCCDLLTLNLNDGKYGTSWGPAGAPFEVDSFAGINLGTERKVSSIAFGRDNTGGNQDRYVGIYTIQYTVVADPGAGTPEGDWINIGQVDYQANPPTRPSFRHRYVFPEVQATGLRIVTDTAGGQLSIFLDEIEVYGETLPLPVIASITPADGTHFADAAAGLRFEVSSTIGVEAAGITLTLNTVDRSGELTVGGDAQNRVVTFSGLETGLSYVAEIQVLDQAGNRAVATVRFDTFTLPGAQLIETGGTFAPNNLATAVGATPFAQSQVGCCDVFTVNLNDGRHGTSWGPDGPAVGVDSFAGVKLSGPHWIHRLAFGRDNTGTHQDRYVGRYTLQYTTVTSPSATTPNADWISLVILDYQAAPPAQPSFRHLYEFEPVIATGVRVVTDTADGQLSIFLDEIEVYEGTPRLRLIETGGVFGANNLATAIGAAPFAKTQAGCCDVFTINLNDGFYGTSWGPSGPAFSVDSFAGINLGAAAQIERIAFGRDNNGQHRDRYVGRYTVQYTQVDVPDATTPDQDWITVGYADYVLLPPDQPSFRHLYEFDPVLATGVRILTDTAEGQLSIFLDEIEVYPAFKLQLTRAGEDIMISWFGDGTLEEALDLSGPWREVPGAQSPFSIIRDFPAKFYRLSKPQ